MAVQPGQINGSEVPLICFGAIFRNDPGGVIDSLNLGFSGEQWVNGFSRR